MKVGDYRCNVKDKELYGKLCKKYEFYTTEEKMTKYKHKFDTQIVDGMNVCVDK